MNDMKKSEYNYDIWPTHKNPQDIMKNLMLLGINFDVYTKEPFFHNDTFAVINWPVVIKKKYPKHVIDLKIDLK